MKLDLSKQESRLPLVDIPEDDKRRIRELDAEFLRRGESRRATRTRNARRWPSPKR
jgi:hypothetical protein